MTLSVKLTACSRGASARSGRLYPAPDVLRERVDAGQVGQGAELGLALLPEEGEAAGGVASGFGVDGFAAGVAGALLGKPGERGGVAALERVKVRQRQPDLA